jgi:YidC/Oxa1 family membrane protein insertase
VRFESAAADGVKLAKTYTFRAASTRSASSTRWSTRQRAGVAAAVPATGARRQPPEGESSFYFTFTGPAVYTEASKFRRSTSRTSPRARPATTRAPTTAGWRWCSTTSLRPGWCPPRAAARVPHRQGGGQPLLGRDGLPLGEVAPGASKAQSATLFAGPQEETSSPRWRPGSSWSRTTAGSPCWPSRCSGC